LGDIQLSRGVHISGRYARDLDDTPMAGVSIVADSTSPCCGDVETGWTDGDGTFTLVVPPNGTYDLNVGLDPEPALITEEVAGLVVASTDVVQDLAALEAATIAGTLTDHAGQPIPGMTVLASHLGGVLANVATSCPDGTYQLHVLPDPNGFTVRTNRPHPRSSTPTHVFKSWTNDPNGTFFDCEADPIAAPAAGDTRSGVDFLLGLAAKAKGKLSTDAGGCHDDLFNIGLTIDDGTDHECSLGEPDPNSFLSGGFTIEGLPSTDDLPSLRACAGVAGFDPQC